MQVAVAIAPGETAAGAALQRDQAFRAAITPLLDVAFRVLRRLGVRDEEIDDALQTVLLIADRRFDDLGTQQELKAYVCATCVNVARDVGRRRARQFARTVAVDDVEATASHEPDPEEVIRRRQALALVQQILDSMDDDRRVVFVLYELEELTGQQIAEHLGIPLGTVSSRLRKAREEFRAAIARLHASERHSPRGSR